MVDASGTQTPSNTGLRGALEASFVLLPAQDPQLTSPAGPTASPRAGPAPSNHTQHTLKYVALHYARSCSQLALYSTESTRSQVPRADFRPCKRGELGCETLLGLRKVPKSEPELSGVDTRVGTTGDGC